MASRTLPHRLRPAMAAVMGTVFAILPNVPADADTASPFGDAPRLADAALDTMRGGFSDNSGNMMRFAVDLQTVVNGQTISSLSISNDSQGKIHGSAKNLGRTFVLQPDGSVQVKMMSPAQSSTPAPTVTTQRSGTSSVTVQLVSPPPTAPTGTGGQQNGSSSMIVTTTLRPTLPSSVPVGAVLATTGLLPNGNGVMTLIQNTQSNVVIHALQNLNIQLSGLSDRLVRGGTASSGFTNSMRFSVHH